jgi:5-formyltetrahydrofolate cyclo-ligase
MADSPPPHDDDYGEFSSPPCFMHEIDAAYACIAVDPTQARDLARWRKAERHRLIACRLAIPIADREANATAIANKLDKMLPIGAETIFSVYWPFRGKPDLRPWMTSLCAKGVQVALPLVVEKAKPLIFRQWHPSVPLARGIWNIPYPADGLPVVPSVIVAPLVGFDPDNYRLGYGGGYFDRTIDAMEQKPLVIGVGHPAAAIGTIYPQPHDIAMDWIVTGKGAAVRSERT